MLWVTEETTLTKSQVQNKSVTELEIEFGAFSAESPQVLFYIRDGIDGDSIPSRFLEPALQASAAQLALKQRICAKFPDRVRRYRLSWNGSEIDKAGLKTLGEMVATDLWQLLYQTGKLTPPTLDEYQLAQRALDTFVNHRRKGFQGREEILERLTTHLRSTQPPSILALTGPGGSGKSAVFAELYARLTNQSEPQPKVLAWAAGANPGLGDVSAILHYWLRRLYTLQKETIPEDLNKLERTDLERQFQLQVSRACLQQQSVILLFDALDQADLEVQNLDWLPNPWPAGLRMVVTVLEGQAQAGLNVHRTDWLILPPLQQIHAESALAGIFAHYGRYRGALPTAITNAVLAHGPEAWGNPLWLSIAGEALNQISGPQLAQIESQRPANQSMGQAIISALATRAQSFATTVPELFSNQLALLETLHEPKLLTAYAGLIATSRHGLRTMDLSELLPKILHRTPIALELTALRYGFRGQIVQREAGQWDFFHRRIREGVAARYLIDQTIRSDLHGHIAEHLQSLPSNDTLRWQETAYHLVGLGDRTRLFNYISGLSSNYETEDPELQGTAITLAELIGTGQYSGDGKPLVDWLMEMLKLAPLGATSYNLVSKFMLFALDPRLVLTRPVGTDRRRLLDALLQGLQRVAVDWPDDLDIQQHISVSMNGLGNLEFDEGNRSRARAYYTEGLEIARNLRQRLPESIKAERHVLVSLNRLGELEWDEGNRSQPRAYYTDSLEIARDLRQRLPESVQAERDVSVSLIKIGELEWGEGNLSQARNYFTEDLWITRGLRQRLPESVQAKRDVSISLKKLGDLERDEGNRSTARAYYTEGLEIARNLRQRLPESVWATRDVWVSLDKLGNLELEESNRGQARAYYAEGLEITKDLLQRLPESAQIERDVSASMNKIGDLKLEDGDCTQARAYYTKSLEIRLGLRQRMPESVYAERDVSVSLNKLGDLEWQVGKHSLARAYYTESLEIARNLRQRLLESVQSERDVWVPLNKLGDLEREEGNRNQARIYYAECLQIAQGLRQRMPESVQIEHDVSISLDKLGDLEREET